MRVNPLTLRSGSAAALNTWEQSEAEVVQLCRACLCDSPTWGGSTGPAVRSGPFSGGLSSGFSPGSFREVPPAGSQCRQRPLVGPRVLRGVRYPGAARTRRFSSMCRADKQYWERSLIVMDYLVITSILFSLNEWNTPFLPSLCQSLMQDN